ncbi:MAG: hypothetical protein ASARMPRED_009311 [Alectoria sarmentosa]|nr:MAG: hypothetical protein ASARMPRED_009311 [Alectoria sarmentosa]
MALAGTNPDGSIILSFTDVWGERQLLFRFTDLCDRAGCHCEGDEMMCFNNGYVLFENALYEMYGGDCESACRCLEEGLNEAASEPDEGSVSSSSLSSDTWSSADSTSRDVDWAAENAQLLRNYYASLVREFDSSTGEAPNRLNNGIPCLAGQAAGWVLARGEIGQCCPGYSFNALTASEAYVLYGVPIDYIVAGVRSIGMCLKSISG